MNTRECPDWRECPECTRKGCAPDNVWPDDDKFWPRNPRTGLLMRARCIACQEEHERTQRRRASIRKANLKRKLHTICRKHTRAA